MKEPLPEAQLFCLWCMYELMAAATHIEAYDGDNEYRNLDRVTRGTPLLQAAAEIIDNGGKVAINQNQWTNIYAQTKVVDTLACYGHLRNAMDFADRRMARR